MTSVIKPKAGFKRQTHQKLPAAYDAASPRTERETTPEQDKTGISGVRQRLDGKLGEEIFLHSNGSWIPVSACLLISDPLTRVRLPGLGQESR
jgi:hypothetical protein